MWRSLFLALGVTCCILGMEALALERAVVTVPDRAKPKSYKTKVIDPPPWAPSSLMAGGAVVVLYSFTTPRRLSG